MTPQGAREIPPTGPGRRTAGAPARALAALLAVLGIGCSSSPEGPDLREQAQAATRTRDWERAAELWHDVQLESGGRDSVAYLETARAMYLAGDPPGACAMLRRGLEAFPNDLELLELSGKIQLECGFRRAAEPVFLRLVELAPERPDPWLELARLRIGLGLERSALEPLGRYIALTGGDVESLAMLGEVHATTGRTLLAYEAYCRASELGDLDARAQVMAATTAFGPPVQAAHEDAFVRARVWLERAAEYDPQSLRAQFLLGRIAEQEGRDADAIAHYRRAIEIDPGDLESLTHLAVLCARVGDVGTADIVGRALAIEADPSRRAALMELLGVTGGGR